MFCDTCHWYTAGEKTCPHCGAVQGPKKAKDMFNLPGDLSVLDDSFMDTPLAGAPMTEPPAPAPVVLPPAPSPKPAPPQAPVPKLIPAPAPAQKPIPAPSAPPAARPAPPQSDVNKQALKILALVLAGVFALILILVIAEMGRDSAYYDDGAYYIYDPDYDDSYLDDEFYTEPVESLEDARAGDLVYFGYVHWRVLDEDAGAVLLLRDYAEHLHPDDIYHYLNHAESYDDVISTGGMVFTVEEFASIRPMPDGSKLFLLSEEEIAQYGVELSIRWYDGYVPVRPAIWVNTW